MNITTWEAYQKYGLSTSYLRRLLARGVIKGREAPITSQRKVWLVDESSLKKYLQKKRRPGRPRIKK